jgi:hypothetical protein
VDPTGREDRCATFRNDEEEHRAGVLGLDYGIGSRFRKPRASVWTSTRIRTLWRDRSRRSSRAWRSPSSLGYTCPRTCSPRRSLDDGLPSGSERFGEPFVVRSPAYTADLPCTMLEYMMSKLLQQYVEPHEVSQPRGLVCGLFVEEELTRCPGLAVGDQTGVEVLGLSHWRPHPAAPHARRTAAGDGTLIPAGERLELHPWNVRIFTHRPVEEDR